jgi:hypothetical protein
VVLLRELSERLPRDLLGTLGCLRPNLARVTREPRSRQQGLQQQLDLLEQQQVAADPAEDFVQRGRPLWLRGDVHRTDRNGRDAKRSPLLDIRPPHAVETGRG